MTFFDRLRDRVGATDGVLAVGLNPELSRLPADSNDHDYPRRAFNRRLVDATQDHAAAYVLNPAFYADSDGWIALAETVAYARGRGVPVVLDAKWNELANPAADLLDRVDAVTVSPYCGRDALAPLFDADDLGVFAVCRTPNAGAANLQDRELAGDDAGSTEDEEDENPSLAEGVATLADSWAEDGAADVGLLVGGPSDRLEALRESAPDLPFFVAGGARNDPEVAEFAAPESGPNEGIGLVGVSREVAYAAESAGHGRARGQDDYAAAARQSARRLKGQLNRHR